MINLTEYDLIFGKHILPTQNDEVMRHFALANVMQERSSSSTLFNRSIRLVYTELNPIVSTSLTFLSTVIPVIILPVEIMAGYTFECFESGTRECLDKLYTVDGHFNERRNLFVVSGINCQAYFAGIMY